MSTDNLLARLAEMGWTEYATHQPPCEGVYEWRVPGASTKGIVVRVLARHQRCGSGILAPSFNYWDGWKNIVPAGTQWRETADVVLRMYEERLVCVKGIELDLCPFCHTIPKIEGLRCGRPGGGDGVFAGAHPHEFNTWSPRCCAWASRVQFADPRELHSARHSALAKEGTQ